MKEKQSTKESKATRTEKEQCLEFRLKNVTRRTLDEVCWRRFVRWSMLATFRQPADLICMRCAGQSFRDARGNFQKKMASNKLPQKKCVWVCDKRLVDNIPIIIV